MKKVEREIRDVKLELTKHEKTNGRDLVLKRENRSHLLLAEEARLAAPPSAGKHEFLLAKKFLFWRLASILIIIKNKFVFRTAIDIHFIRNLSK